MSKALILKDIHKVFNKGTVNEKIALNGLSIELEAGDFVTIIGGNGAGKSTMLNAIAGVWPVDSGRIIVNGDDITMLPEHKRAMYLGRVFQDPMTGTAATMDIEENMALVSTLKNFKAKVHTTMEKSSNDNGSRTDNYRQAVDSNLPKEFIINIPIFKGTAPEKIKIETMAHVSGDNVSLELISADAAAIEEEVRDTLINKEIDKIRELAPEIPIIEV